MRKLTQEQINKILEEHKHWLVVMILVLLTKLGKLLKHKILIPIVGKNVQEEYTSSLIDRKQSIIDVGETK